MRRDVHWALRCHGSFLAVCRACMFSKVQGGRRKSYVTLFVFWGACLSLLIHVFMCFFWPSAFAR